jgi:hypothetical protein
MTRQYALDDQGIVDPFLVGQEIFSKKFSTKLEPNGLPSLLNFTVYVEATFCSEIKNEWICTSYIPCAVIG